MAAVDGRLAASASTEPTEGGQEEADLFFPAVQDFAAEHAAEHQGADESSLVPVRSCVR